jgi:hypothetical protein
MQILPLLLSCWVTSLVFTVPPICGMRQGRGFLQGLLGGLYHVLAPGPYKPVRVFT